MASVREWPPRMAVVYWLPVAPMAARSSPFLMRTTESKAVKYSLGCLFCLLRHCITQNPLYIPNILWRSRYSPWRCTPPRLHTSTDFIRCAGQGYIKYGVAVVDVDARTRGNPFHAVVVGNHLDDRLPRQSILFRYLSPLPVVETSGNIIRCLPSSCGALRLRQG